VPAITGNENDITQILINLVTNAWKAIGKDRGSIRLSINPILPVEITASPLYPMGWQSHDSAYFCIEVADTGIGIFSARR